MGPGRHILGKRSHSSRAIPRVQVSSKSTTGLAEGMRLPRDVGHGWVHILSEASRGPHAAQPRLRRVGVGLAQLPWLDLRVVATHTFNLVDEEDQEVGRDETAATLEA